MHSPPPKPQSGSQPVTPAELTQRTPLPRHEAERLLAVAMGLPRNKALTRLTVPGPLAAAYRGLVARRRRGEPLQYIEGSVLFGPVEIAVDPRVLIPRVETEQLFAIVASWGPPGVLVDMCTGSGCLGIALAATFPGTELHMTDISRDALDVASANARRNGVPTKLWRGDGFAALPDELRGRVDCFVANPPYVADAEFDGLESQVRDHEPPLALLGGPDGLGVVRPIAADLATWLRPGGAFAIEIGHGQAEAAGALFADLGGTVVADLNGRERFVVGETGRRT